jgi:NADH dehydrogenase
MDVSVHRQTVIVLGGGFAGIAVCRRLERNLPTDWSVVLINADNAHVLTPLLPEAVGASMLPGHAVVPLRQMLPRTRIVTGRVTAVDADRRLLVLEHGQPFIGYTEVRASEHAEKPAVANGSCERQMAGGLLDAVI